MTDASSVLHDLNRPKEALAAAVAAIDKDPTLPAPWERAASVFIHHRKWEEARRLLALAIQSVPGSALIRAQYALCLSRVGALDAAYGEMHQAMQLQPDLHQALIARIEILWAAGYYDLALRHSLLLRDKGTPGAATYSQGSTTFMTGDFAKGMKLLGSVIDRGDTPMGLPHWNGEASPDHHLVLFGAQGHGDRIHFARYIDSVRARVEKITLLMPPALAGLMRDSFPDLTVVTDATQLPPEAVACPLTALPGLLQKIFDALANKVPYIHARPELAAAWRERLASIPRPRMGLVWSSDSWYSNDPVTLISFDVLKPLIDVAGAHLVSLQLGEKAAQAAAAGLFDASPFIKDFADSAALVSELDLVISLDSAPAHLAGALGKPVWLMVPFKAEWRWLIGREDSIWYPTMRLFRMDKPEDWPGVAQKLCLEIKRLLSGDTKALEPTSWTGPPLRRHPTPVPLPGIESEPGFSNRGT